jgi:hypothetical protein
MALFPLISLPDLEGQNGSQKLFREVAWDLRNNKPIWRGGEPVYVTGASAVLVWAWNAIQAEKGLYDVFTRDYGLGIREGLLGKAYTDDVRQSEGARYVQECLMTNPYITSVTAVSVTFEASWLEVTCRIQTVYGEVNVNGCRV